LALVVGEALVKYADALGAGEWSSEVSEWKEGAYDESYAFGLPRINMFYIPYSEERPLAQTP